MPPPVPCCCLHAQAARVHRHRQRSTPLHTPPRSPPWAPPAAPSRRACRSPHPAAPSPPPAALGSREAAGRQQRTRSTGSRAAAADQVDGQQGGSSGPGRRAAGRQQRTRSTGSRAAAADQVDGQQGRGGEWGAGERCVRAGDAACNPGITSSVPETRATGSPAACHAGTPGPRPHLPQCTCCPSTTRTTCRAASPASLAQPLSRKVALIFCRAGETRGGPGSRVSRQRQCQRPGRRRGNTRCCCDGVWLACGWRVRNSNRMRLEVS